MTSYNNRYPKHTGTILCDGHTHSSFSTDSTADPVSQINAAVALGLKDYYFTDHMDIGYPNGEFVFDTRDYIKTLTELKAAYADKIALHIGIELGLRPESDIVAENKKIVSAYPYDVTIGSIHVVDGYDPYYKEYWDGYGEERGLLRYYESMLESILAFTNFDTLGHIDYITRYCPSKGKIITRSYALQKKIHRICLEVLELLIKEGKALELNTAAWKYGLLNPHPGPELLTAYKKMGGTLITVGSDGHKPEHIAWDFDRAATYLKRNGFDSYIRFEHHEPKKIKL